MGKTTGISWTGTTWNPWHGCHKVSAGCKFCYMFRDKERYGQDPNIVVRSKPATFYAPLKWQREAEQGTRMGHDRLVFTCSWSDFFIEEADLWRDEAFAIMALCPDLIFQVLTKHSQRMHAYMTDMNTPARIAKDAMEWPLRSVWLGVSAENQATADERIPFLLRTPAVIKFLSYEPALERVDFRPYLDEDRWTTAGRYRGLDWIICGGESGPKARPFQLTWAQSVLRQCQASGVPFFMKQLGSNAYDFHELLKLGEDGRTLRRCGGCVNCRRRTRQKAGADPAEWPASLRIQAMPPY